MKTQKIIWTALPNGITSEGKLRLSVLVSPRLETDEILPRRSTPLLRQFEDFLDWPPKDLKFSVAFEDGASIRQLPAMITNKSEPQLWQTLFKIDTPVDSYTFDDYSSRIVRSYPMSNIMSFIKTQYQRIAIKYPTTFGPFQELGNSSSFGQIDMNINNPLLQGLEAKLNTILSQYGAVPPDSSPNTTTMDFLQLKLFHRPHSHLDNEITARHEHPKYVEYKQAKLENKFDFHRMLSLLLNYPNLLRHFGLAFEIEVAIPPSVNIPITSAVWVVPQWSAILPNSKNITPHTKYMKGFRAQPKASELKEGMLDLTSTLYDLVEVDVDGAAIKAMNLASNMNLSRIIMRTVDTPDSFSVPSLQSAGLSLVRRGRAYTLKQDLVKSKKNNDDIASNQVVTLFAEDLICGFRIDIYDKMTRNWYSLCDRIATYKFLNARFPPIIMEDEGYVSLGATESATGLVESPSISSLPDLYFSEALFRWSGWSLCVPRPTTRINNNVKEPKPEPFLQNDSTVSKEFKLLCSFSIKKRSLPRLRFGNTYRMRVRIADLTGKGLTKDQADSRFATKEVKYLRFEPISAPALVLHHSIQNRPGESAENLVVRTRNDIPEKDLIDPPTLETTERYIASPLCAPSMAETHGKFDDEGGLMKEAYRIIVSKEGTFKNVHPESKLVLPYLPDPLCHGASFLGLPGKIRGLIGISGIPSNKEIEYSSEGAVTITDLSSIEKPAINLLKVDFGPENEWPNAKPFLIRVEGVLEGKAPVNPKWDAKIRVLTISLPQAAITTVRLSSYVGKEQIPVLGIWDWIKNSSLTSEELQKLEYYSVQGRHWMMTPFRDISLVHAVQQPLGKVDFSHLISIKEIGSTFAVLDDDPKVHIKSTGTVEVLANWNEMTDDLSLAGPASIERFASAFRFSVEYPDPIDPENKNPKKIKHPHEFGDTKYRSVNYTLLATTRFHEYFEKNPTDSVDKFTRKSKPISIDILNSARPNAPKILYVIPTFGWKREFDERSKKFESTRFGGGLRVYLERPWFSSGNGELLGIVLAGPNTSPSELERLKPYITRWGGDPIWSSGLETFGPLERDFKNKVTNELGITLEELGDLGVGNNYSISVVGYNVDYDYVRKLWFCDIEIDTHGKYFPFVRLALARYQPKSVKKTTEGGNTRDVKVSPVVLADFVQLSPDRTASITYVVEPNGKVLYLAISGVSGFGRNEAYMNEIEVILEKRDPTKGGKDLGWTMVGQVEPSQTIPSEMLWFGTVTLSEPMSETFRLVIKEFEKFNVTVDGSADPIIGKRMVYAEIIDII